MTIAPGEVRAANAASDAVAPGAAMTDGRSGFTVASQPSKGCGNEIGGIRVPDLSVPLATTTCLGAIRFWVSVIAGGLAFLTVLLGQNVLSGRSEAALASGHLQAAE